MAVETSMAPTNGATELSAAAARLIYRDRQGNPYNAVQVELIVALCRKHGLVPELGHIALISDRAYVTNAGLLHKAHDVGDTDGIITRPATPQERTDFLLGNDSGTIHLWQAEVWRKGQSRPYVGWGQVKPGEKGAGQSNPAEMACTRAVNRALRLAYDVGMTSAEELTEDAQPGRTVDQQTGEIRQAPPRVMAAPRQQSAPPPVPAGVPDRPLTPEEATRLSRQIVQFATDQGYAEADALDWIERRVLGAGKDGLAELTREEGKALHAAAKVADFGPEPPAERELGEWQSRLDADGVAAR